MTTATTEFHPYRDHRRLLEPDEVRALSELRPARMILDCAVSWGWIVAAWTAVAIWPTWWMIAIAIPIIGSREYALHVIGHDGIHRRLFSNPKWNDWFCDLVLFGPIGGVVRRNGRNHLLHHQLLSSREDPDRYKYASVDKASPLRTLWFLTGLSGLVPAFRHVFLNRRAGESEAPDPQDAAPRYSARDLVIVGLWQLALVVGLSASVGWWGYPVLWILPVYGFTYCANLARQFLEHAHPEADDHADRHRLITFASNPIERIFMAPMNMNYHTVHHLWPSIPYYNLPEADRRVRERSPSADLHWYGSYWSGLGRYLHGIREGALRTDAPPRSEK